MPIIWDGAYQGLGDNTSGYPLLEDQEAIDKQYDQFTQEIHRCLEGWFQGLEDNHTYAFLPLAHYPKFWSDQELEDLVVAIDTYVEQQRHWCNDGGAKLRDSKERPYDQHCGFSRLKAPQRLALAQDLDRICQEFNKTTGPSIDIENAIAYG